MSDAARVKVWDIGVRLFHWSLVVLFAVAYVTGEMEGSAHAAAGYAVLALLLFRLAWGLVGTRHARFADFVYGPVATWRYAKALLARRPPHYLGHNPLGGWMVVALLLVFPHIAGALAASVLHRENLVEAMLTGYKRPAGPRP